MQTEVLPWHPGKSALPTWSSPPHIAVLTSRTLTWKDWKHGASLAPWKFVGLGALRHWHRPVWSQKKRSGDRDEKQERGSRVHERLPWEVSKTLE